LKSFKDFILESPPINRIPNSVVNQRQKYLSKVTKGKPVSKKDGSFSRPRRGTAAFRSLPVKVRRILGVNI